MKLQEVRDLLDAEVLCGEEKLDLEVHAACGSDLMSDVLAFVKEQAVLLTGLLNPQVVRTAEMMDMHCIVIVRGKTPDPQFVELARKQDIVLMSTKYRMFSACGYLFAGGLKGESGWR